MTAVFVVYLLPFNISNRLRKSSRWAEPMGALVVAVSSGEGMVGFRWRERDRVTISFTVHCIQWNCYIQYAAKNSFHTVGIARRLNGDDHTVVQPYITDTLEWIILSIIERLSSFGVTQMYDCSTCRIYIRVHVGWCIGKCSLYRGVLYSTFFITVCTVLCHIVHVPRFHPVWVELEVARQLGWTSLVVLNPNTESHENHMRVT